MAYIGSSPTKVVSRQSANIFTYTAVANQVAFTGSDANGNTLACTPSDIMVHMNGIKLEESDYTASTTTVTLGSGAAAGDEVTITAFVTFESADHYDKSTSDTRYVNAAGDTMTGNLGINETSPSGSLHVKGTSSTHGKIILEAGGSGGSANNNFMEFNKHDGTKLGELEVGESVTNGGSLVFKTTPSGGSATTRMTINHDGIVTKPNQPFIECEGNSASNYSYSAQQVIAHWSNKTTPVGITRSGGRFTVPVAGKYLFCFTLYSYVTADGHYRNQIKINGSVHSITQLEVGTGMRLSSGPYDYTIMSSHILNMSANDYVEIIAADAQQMYRGSEHNALSMMLVG